jgi:hypothetical protein
MVACGFAADRAKAIIEAAACDAISGHSRLVDNALLEVVTQFGGRSFLPHPRSEVFEPASIP